MDPRRKPDRQDQDEIRDEGPALEEQDWEAIESGAIAPDSIPENGDLRYDIERSGEAPEEGDEAAISRDPSKEGSRFDEI